MVGVGALVEDKIPGGNTVVGALAKIIRWNDS